MKTHKPRPKRLHENPVNINTCIVRENLPLSFVHYPNMYGSFFGFSETQNGQVYLCSCVQPALENLLALKELRSEGQYATATRMAAFDDWRFPPVIARLSQHCLDNPMNAVSFRQSICHRCNLATPNLRWCHEMYGGPFKQHFGWYIEQTYLRLGVLAGASVYLPDVCPPDIQQQIVNAVEAQEKYRAEDFRLKQIAFGPKRNDIAADEITYWANVKPEEAELMKDLRRDASRLMGEFHNRVENITRTEFGFSNVGEGWISENILYLILCSALPGAQIVRHYKPKWLEGLELDFYIPQWKLGIEYQGQQHFHPVRAWGGQIGLLDLQRRDERKAALCKQTGISLVTVDYTDPLTIAYITERLKKHGLKFEFVLNV